MPNEVAERLSKDPAEKFIEKELFDLNFPCVVCREVFGQHSVEMLKRCFQSLGRLTPTADDEQRAQETVQLKLTTKNGAFIPEVREQVLIPAICHVAGHFRFQENGGNCTMCQRTAAIEIENKRLGQEEQHFLNQQEAIERAVRKVWPNLQSQLLKEVYANVPVEAQCPTRSDIIQKIEAKRDSVLADLLKSQRAAEDRNDEATADSCCNSAMDIREFSDSILALLREGK